MSYSITVTAKRPDVVAELRAKADATITGYNQDGKAATTDHLEAAMQAVAYVLNSVQGGAEADDELKVTVTGHANPDHDPEQGAAENITVSIAVT